MTKAREIKVVIKAKDEFSAVLQSAALNAKSTASDIRSAFEDLSTGDNATFLDAYAASLGKVMSLESARSEQMKKSMAEMDMARLSGRSPYQTTLGSASTGSEVVKDYAVYNSRLAALERYNTQVLDAMSRAGKSQGEIEAQYTELSLAYAQKRRDYQIAYAADSFGAMANFMQNLYVATGSHNRQMFEAMKAFAISQTIIDTYRTAQGAASAVASIPYAGPALAVAAAAAAIVAGMARVAAISAQHPGGGTSISAAGTANPPYSGGSPNAYPVPQRMESQPSQNVTVIINNPLSDQNWQKIVEDNIVPALNTTGQKNIPISINVVKN